jgi:hypothetical protein
VLDRGQERACRLAQHHLRLERLLAQVVVRPRDAGLVMRLGERVESLAERRERLEIGAGVDRADDPAEPIMWLSPLPLLSETRYARA